MHGYTKVEIGDHCLSKILKKYGWDGDYKQQGEITSFLENDTTLAIVKYENRYPVSKEVWLKNELVGRRP